MLVNICMHICIHWNWPQANSLLAVGDVGIGCVQPITLVAIKPKERKLSLLWDPCQWSIITFNRYM